MIFLVGFTKNYPVFEQVLKKERALNERGGRQKKPRKNSKKEEVLFLFEKTQKPALSHPVFYLSIFEFTQKNLTCPGEFFASAVSDSAMGWGGKRN